VNKDDYWKDIIARLELELESRGKSAKTETIYQQAWYEVYALLQQYGEVLLKVEHRDISAEDMEDIVTETLLKLQSAATLRRLRLAGSPRGYLLRMMRNACVDFKRRTRRERELLRLFDATSISEASEQATEAADSPLVRLREEFKLLSEDEQELLRMRFWDGMTIREMAEKTGTSYSATAVKLFRVLRRLRDRLLEDGGSWLRS